jgi:hypothetical protein
VRRESDRRSSFCLQHFPAAACLWFYDTTAFDWATPTEPSPFSRLELMMRVCEFLGTTFNGIKLLKLLSTKCYEFVFYFAARNVKVYTQFIFLKSNSKF